MTFMVKIFLIHCSKKTRAVFHLLAETAPFLWNDLTAQRLSYKVRIKCRVMSILFQAYVQHFIQLDETFLDMKIPTVLH